MCTSCSWLGFCFIAMKIVERVGVENQKIIYDIGANNGDDTAFYLAKGFKTIAVEANPKLCVDIEDKFSAAIGSGELVVENVGVAENSSTLPFYVNSFDSWSSFHKASKAANTNNYDVVSVETQPLSEIVEKHGTPHYIKLDIEGFELKAVSTLNSLEEQAPFLSFEINEDWKEILQTMKKLGYKKFQIVRQGPDMLPPCPRPAREGKDVEINFNNHMSGPFGQDLPPENWIQFSDIFTAVEDVFAQRKENVDRGDRPGWHDIHCALN